MYSERIASLKPSRQTASSATALAATGIPAIPKAPAESTSQQTGSDLFPNGMAQTWSDCNKPGYNSNNGICHPIGRFVDSSAENSSPPPNPVSRQEPNVQARAPENTPYTQPDTISQAAPQEGNSPIHSRDDSRDAQDQAAYVPASRAPVVNPTSTRSASTPDGEGAAPAQPAQMKNVATRLVREGEHEFAQQNYSVAIANARAALQMTPGDRRAQQLLDNAQQAQQQAMNGISIR